MANNNQVNNPHKAHWITYAFAALTLLIVVFGLAYLISGREIIERPILIFFLLLAWLGLLSGIALGRSTN
jgi:protein-S-isoprenylcysteine O-methyltransferase Ste14